MKKNAVILKKHPYQFHPYNALFIFTTNQNFHDNLWVQETFTTTTCFLIELSWNLQNTVGNFCCAKKSSTCPSFPCPCPLRPHATIQYYFDENEPHVWWGLRVATAAPRILNALNHHDLWNFFHTAGTGNVTMHPQQILRLSRQKDSTL